ncbi:DNA-protecting protein DprA [Nitrospirales bacterium NOB]|nr:DNA-protecting protein DprA [Nitrospira sp. NTP2]MDL1888013.1 DNA-protecting protein DprA [Nitrospirales bacterium NOB]QOJ37133.1 MAG: DNA-protecting protein DprA [Nitrospira sp.]
MADHPLRPWLLLRAVPGVGDTLLLKLVQACGTPEAVLRASPPDLEELGCRPPLIEAIRRGVESSVLHDIDDELMQLQAGRVRVLTYCDPEYPSRLRTIPDPPPLLYVQGALTDGDQHAIAIVGSRTVSAVGRVVAEELAHDLAAMGFTIVSGLARGVDGAAHRGALAAKGRTLAVMGCGLDRTYPTEHRRLRAAIEQQGAVISELPLGAAPQAHHFPRRNRIISGLAFGVIVTEASLESGSLITARLAAEQGREVFAVPGFVKAENCRGSNRLIRDGARLIECAQDVVDELLPQLDAAFRRRLEERTSIEAAQAAFHLGNEERLVYDALSDLPCSVDEVIRRSGLDAAQVAAVLLSLELRHCLRQLPGNEYIRLGGPRHGD